MALSWPKLPYATRLQLLLAVLLAVLAAGYRFLFSTSKQATAIVQYGGYWLIGATVVIFGVVLAGELWRHRPGWSACRRHWLGLLVAALGALYWQVHEPHEFKVLFDEHVLAGTAYKMHFEREAAYPSNGHFVNGRIYTLYSAVDKRPLLYPFAVSMVHDLTGYRPENSFIVNGALGFVLLLLVYITGQALGGWRVGCLGQLLFIGLPLLAQNATGGGFDLLNITILAGLLLAGWNYWRQPGTRGLDLWIMSAVLLANCRYESLLYVGVAPVLVLAKWLREKEVTFSWCVTALPVFALLPLLCNQVFASEDSFYQTTPENFLNPRHIPDNINHALRFLFLPGLELNNSVLLSVVGVLALGWALFNVLRHWRTTWRASGLQTPLLLLVAAVLVNVFIALNLAWGHWDEPMVSRFSLPLSLVFVWCVMYAAAAWVNRGRRLPGCWLIGLGVWAVAASAPVSSWAFATGESEAYQTFRWARQYMQDHGGDDVLIASRSTLMFTLYGQPSVSIGKVNVAPQKVANLTKLGLYREVWAIQEYMINRKLNAWVELQSARLDQRLTLEPIIEYPLSPTIRVRISRVTGFDPTKPAGTVLLGGEVGTAAATLPNVAGGIYQREAQTNTERVLTARKEGEPAAVQSVQEIPEDYSDLREMIIRQLP